MTTTANFTISPSIAKTKRIHDHSRPFETVVQFTCAITGKHEQYRIAGNSHDDLYKRINTMHRAIENATGCKHNWQTLYGTVS